MIARIARAKTLYIIKDIDKANGNKRMNKSEYLESLKQNDQVILAIDKKRIYARIREVHLTYLSLESHGNYRKEDGKLFFSTHVSSTDFIVVNPTQEDYDKAEREDLIWGVQRGTTRAKLENLDLDTLRKLVDILH